MPYEKVIEFCKKEGISIHVFEKEALATLWWMPHFYIL